jgi:bifunctional non-homologous end joining protein LigD
VIPAGEYGGGTVMLWDHGTWEPEVDVDAGLRDGELKFSLHGKKLRGSWALVRTRGMRGGSDGRSWLLLKHRDQYATDADIATEKPRSILSKKSMAQIARAAGGDVEKAAKADPAL